MASTFLKAQGIDVGASLVEDDQLETARQIIAEANDRGVVARPARSMPSSATSSRRMRSPSTVDVYEVPAGWMILDVGAVTVNDYKLKLDGVKTVVWNGPLGVFEWDAFAEGSRALARWLADAPATVVIGGGETVALVQGLGLADKYAHVSTGGGASLEFLEGKTLPGVAALLDNEYSRSGL